MKKVKVVNVKSLLSDLDSAELKALKHIFNAQFRENMDALVEAERVEIREFIDGLKLDNTWRSDNMDVVSLNRWALSRDQRSKLREISDTISLAFGHLKELKADVAKQAQREGTAYHRMFVTTVKRMNRYKGTKDYGARWRFKDS